MPVPSTKGPDRRLRVLSATDVVHVPPDGSGEVSLDVVNTGVVIDAISARVIGLPAEVATVTPAMLPLFPDASGQIVVRLDLPGTFPAGRHPVTVELTGQAPGITHHDLDVVVSSSPQLSLAASPSAIRSYRKARFDVHVRNTGNVPLDISLRVGDGDRALQTTITPSTLTVAPGGLARAAVTALAPRRFLGSEQDRALRVTASAADVDENLGLVLKQRPLLSRGMLTALTLLAIIVVWAAIFLIGIAGVLGSDPLTKTVPASFFAAAQETAAEEGSGSAPADALPRDGRLPAGVGATLAGAVTGATDGEGVGRITVEALRRGRDGLVVEGSTATQADGSFTLSGLFPGDYLLRFTAEGFDELWFPDAADDAGAEPVPARAQEVTEGLSAVLTGHPGRISGTVDVGEVTEPVSATVSVRATWTGEDEEITAQTQTGADGSYTLPDLPAPGTYELTVTAEGYAPTTITERITGGQHRFASDVRLGAAAGAIAGMVDDGATPLGGVAVTTTVGDTEVAVGTPTVGAVGTFIVPGLPTPGTYVLTFTKDGYTPQTVVIDLSAGESRTDLSVTMTGGAGTVRGRVTDADGAGLGAVDVTVGGAATTVSATTLTDGEVGSFTIAGLEPGSYTLTFSRDGYLPVTVPVNLTEGTADPVAVTLRPAVGTIDGYVTSGGRGLAGAEIEATDGRQVWSTTTTDPPRTESGRPTTGYFQLGGLPEGSYTVSVRRGGEPVASALVAVTPGSITEQLLEVP